MLKLSAARMANETGGEVIFISLWKDALDVRLDVLDNLINLAEEQRNKDKVYVDFDEDGLYDFYEENGMLLSNWTIVHTDSKLTDSDGDGKNKLLNSINARSV